MTWEMFKKWSDATVKVQNGAEFVGDAAPPAENRGGRYDAMQ